MNRYGSAVTGVVMSAEPIHARKIPSLCICRFEALNVYGCEVRHSPKSDVGLICLSFSSSPSPHRNGNFQMAT